MNQPQPEKTIDIDFGNPQPFFDKNRAVVVIEKKNKTPYPKSVVREMLDIIRQNRELIEKTDEPGQL